jgi:dTDP-glucose 4,6-dehydratase
VKVLVTGAAGFIGSNLVHYIRKLRPSWQITALDLLTYAGNLKNISSLVDNSEVAFERIDIADESEISSLFEREKFDLVFHLAAESHVDRSIADPLAFVEVNVMGTAKLLNQARVSWSGQFEGKRFYHISTDEVYGSLKNNEKAFTEKSQYRPNNPYSASKAAADHIVRAFHVTHQLPTITLHCSNNYGPNQHSEKFIPTIIRSALLNKKIPIYGKGSNIRDWINVRDFADAILKVINKGKVGEVYNVGGNCQISNLELVLKITAYLDKIQPSKTSYKNLISFVTNRKGHDFRYDIDISKIKSELKSEFNI